MQTRSVWSIFGITVVAAVLLATASCKGNGIRIDSLDPPFGNVAGDDDIVIIGQGFKPGLTVLFRKRPAKKVVLESDTKIRVKTPAGPEGKVDVVVTDATGKTYVLENAFTYRKETSP